MQLKLKIVGGKRAGEELPVNGGNFLIGRGEACQLRPRDPAVAEQHCQLTIEPFQVSVRDLGSASGTWVNARRIEAPQVLKSGDRLRVGSLEFEVRLQASLAAKKQPKVSSLDEAAVRAASRDQPQLDLDSWLAPSPDDEDEWGAPIRRNT